ncbi:40S ribosomal protein S16 [Conglomerata obtusa]
MNQKPSISTTGKKKTAVATCTATKSSTFALTIDNIPFHMIKDKLLVSKIREIINVVERSNICDLSFEIFTAQGGPTARIYAARQAFARAVIAYYGKYYDEYKKMEIKNRLLSFDKYALVTDSRRREPKKFGGPGARARYQKSYR